MLRRDFLARAAAAVAGFFGLGVAQDRHWTDWKTEKELQTARELAKAPTFSLQLWNNGWVLPDGSVPVLDQSGNTIGKVDGFRFDGEWVMADVHIPNAPDPLCVSWFNMFQMEGKPETTRITLGLAPRACGTWL